MIPPLAMVLFTNLGCTYSACIYSPPVLLFHDEDVGEALLYILDNIFALD